MSKQYHPKDIEPQVQRHWREQGTFEVDEAEGGEKALALIADQPYDLVLTDLSMPEMSGRELAFRIRQHHPRQPIILLTGDTDAKDGTEHVDVVVKKPFKLDDLEAVVQRLLNG